ncbi:MAG: mechanosensitive ion channel [Gammaproteobacteria bacterium]|nr:mechanosensitive ion channel [Gammaproteobacteria bacterium]
MKGWLDLSNWGMLLDNLELWWFEEVLIPSNLIQILLIAAAFLVAWLASPKLRRLVKRWRDRSSQIPAVRRVFDALDSITITLTWLTMQWIAILAAGAAGLPHPLLITTASLLTAWLVIRLMSHWLDSPFWSRLLALTAWTIAALNILGLLPETMELLERYAITIGEFRISMLTVIEGGITFGVLLWLAVALAGYIERKLRFASGVNTAARVLFGKFVRIGLVTLAVLVSLNSLGIDLTALAVLSGALAVGLGFGLQKIFSNLVSGVILLLDKSIKPGDVIAVGQTYGWINHLGARYVSVVTRDGVEHLIPNEDLIVQRVENWSHSDNLVRLRIPIGVSYNTDPRLAIRLCKEAAQMVPRVLLDPEPRCQLRAFGENSLDLELRIWVNDPQNGRANVISEVLLGIWDSFQEHGVEIPFPQRDLHLRSSKEAFWASPSVVMDASDPKRQGPD